MTANEAIAGLASTPRIQAELKFWLHKHTDPEKVDVVKAQWVTEHNCISLEYRTPPQTSPISTRIYLPKW